MNTLHHPANTRRTAPIRAGSLATALALTAMQASAAWRLMGGPRYALLAPLPQRHGAVLAATWAH
jgi:hypothetical protein